jgi:hypothetical protein
MIVTVTRLTVYVQRNIVGFCHGNVKMSSLFISVGVDTDLNNVMVLRVAMKMIEWIHFVLL